MNSKYLYLSIDLISFVFPFLASFDKRTPFYKKWKYFGICGVITGTFFALWDEIFTQEKVWGFNPEFITGLYIGSLPIEEILFFICIPYACVFTYFTLNNLVAKDHLFPHQELISSGLIILLLISGIYNIEKWYTGITFILLACFWRFRC